MIASQKIFLKNTEGKILALRRSATDPHRPLTWDLPGGILEEGEGLAENLEREILEEIGIAVIAPMILGACSGTGTKGDYGIQIAYHATVDDPQITLSHEHDEHRWLTKEEFLELESTNEIKEFLMKL